MASMDRCNQHTNVVTVRTQHVYDILRIIDNRKVVVLVLLDLPEAFDTVDHDIILHRLERLLGLRGKPLA